MKLFSNHIAKILLTSVVVWVVINAMDNFYQVAWGTGIWLGEFARTWAIFFCIFAFFCVLFLTSVVLCIWKIEYLADYLLSITSFRRRLGWVRWLAGAFVLIFPAWFFQYTVWGIVFHDFYIRFFFWTLAVMALAFFIKDGDALFDWTEFLVAVLLTGSVFVIVASLMNVTSYPFSLGWSEGNRLWDYSILFGHHLYEYPADRDIPVLLDVGRQLVGGLPFLIPGLTIGAERFWVGLTIILPYLFLGLAAFRSIRGKQTVYVLAVLWTLLFLKQGPIHPPLVLCAMVVALIWRQPLWLALPAIAVIGYAAEVSRYTWLFAPGMWIGMLELAGAEIQDGKLSFHSWLRTILLGLTGVAGGVFGPTAARLFANNAASSLTTTTTVASVSASASAQPLLWYRLLPNATYGTGILAGLFIAVLPLIIVLLYLFTSKIWKLNIWQALAIVFPLLAFLVVGIIVSTKIGGGGDLHNLDMFLLGLFFTAVVALEKIGVDRFAKSDILPIGVRFVFLLLLALPSVQPLSQMRSHNYVENSQRLVTLTSVADEKALDIRPSSESVETALQKIREETAYVQSRGGKVLFMDQRQLLTFAFIKNVTLIPEYEKKYLMEQALGSNKDYFRQYYTDLAAKRFGLIVSEPLRKPVKDSSFQFGEENNAWVKWVSIPTLCYYEPKITLKKVGVQLLVPRMDTTDCRSVLPDGTAP